MTNFLKRSFSQSCFVLAIYFLFSPAYAQNISLDHPVKCGRLQCFPSADVENDYYYLPSVPHIALMENNKPYFYFLRYSQSAPDTRDGSGGLLEATSGSIVQFKVDFTVSKSLRTAAEKALTDISKNAVLRGPIVFEAGTFALVSSFAPDEDNPSDLSRRVIGAGRAPLIDGLKTAAVAMHLTNKDSQILWRSFLMDAPDVSLVFEMTFSGLNDPAEATITADWSKLQDTADVTLGAQVSYLGIRGSFDYGNFWETARNNGAINIEYKGDPDKLQGIIDRAYARLHELMFEPIPVAEVAIDGDDDPLQSLLAVTDAAAQANGSSYSAPWEVKINGGYKRRKVTHTGTYTLDFRQRSKSSLTTAMAGNIGSLYRLYGDDRSIFHEFNFSDDPTFRKREIYVALDARDEQEITKYTNAVTFTLQRTHSSGETTADSLIFNRRDIESGQPKRIRYGWLGEKGLEQWLRYRYKTEWWFDGGARYSSDWVETNAGAITLTPPYRSRRIEFLTSPDILAEANVHMVSIRVQHDFFGRQVVETINIIPAMQQFNETRIFAIPQGENSIEYVITWTLNDGRKITSGTLTSDETVIFCDELPPPI